MPNLREMDVYNSQLDEIDKVIRSTKNFLDKKAYLKTEKGEELLTVMELEQRREEIVTKLRRAGTA